MGLHRQEVLQRRAALLEKISGQRAQIAETGERLRPVFQVADQAVQAGRFLAAHPVLVAGLAGLLVVRRRGMLGLVRGAWRAWQAYRYFGAVSKKLNSRL
ncbi:MAG: YqjK-like family protein [Gallionella sp.]|nr:YqjK-like family protein [Gallionella sp.]MDD4945861.1 YqjK-like family protein [Gallionella sp.]MDD5612504.1 YqjK-like family protein [Gallionella sp.]